MTVKILLISWVRVADASPTHASAAVALQEVPTDPREVPLYQMPLK